MNITLIHNVSLSTLLGFVSKTKLRNQELRRWTTDTPGVLQTPKGEDTGQRKEKFSMQVYFKTDENYTF